MLIHFLSINYDLSGQNLRFRPYNVEPNEVQKRESLAFYNINKLILCLKIE